MVNRTSKTAQQRHPDLQTTLQALQSLSDDGLPYTTIFYGLSGLTDEQIAQVKPVWQSTAPARRAWILRHMIELSETDFEMDYHAIGILSLDDPDPQVRAAAIDVLWDDESLELMARLIDMAQWDEALEVQAAATSALGRFIYLGEIGDLPESKTIEAQDVVIGLWSNHDKHVDIRRRALEAISNCGHDLVPGAIQEAYSSPNPLMRASALFAMGRTYDSRWMDIVLHEIDSDQPEIRYEAARAAGELELRTALPGLARLAAGTDREVQDIAIWSLGEIGTQEAVRVLEKLAETAEMTENMELLEAIDDAIANASIVMGAPSVLFDTDAFEDGELDD